MQKKVQTNEQRPSDAGSKPLHQRYSLLKPSTQQRWNRDIYGFDIETANKNKDFVMASIVGINHKKLFYTKESVCEELKNKRYRNSLIATTNLAFDFFGTFHGLPDMKNFTLLHRGSDLIYAKTYIHNGKLHKFRPKVSKSCLVTFIDTMNYAHLSVQKMGIIIGFPKGKKPSFLGQHPKNQKEWDELINYNLQDSKVSRLFLKFLLDSFYKIGASSRPTIASSAMSLFKNKYLDRTLYRHKTESLIEQFKGYYGGRTEAFCRGYFSENDNHGKPWNYYDFNSLYPSVMTGEYPDPNSMRYSYENSDRYIEFDGVMDVTVHCPPMEYPLLPYRTEHKLLFPTGTFRGWYSNVELRKAITLGYTIKEVHKSIYFKDQCFPFKDYVHDLYELRLQYQRENSPMEYVVKILANSLYGKFGQKFDNMEEWQPLTLTKSQLDELKYFEIVGDYIRIKKGNCEPAPFCIPIWALYTTAYARIKLHDYITRSHPIYVDTDSLITTKEFSTSKRLGGLKLEMPISHGFIVRPKFYAFVPTNNWIKEQEAKKAKYSEYYTKAKGVGVKLSLDAFKALLTKGNLNENNYNITGGTVFYNKFSRFKESLRRGFVPNEIIDAHKTLSLEDEKRKWNGTFNPYSLESSSPVNLEDNRIPKKEFCMYES